MKDKIVYVLSWLDVEYCDDSTYGLTGVYNNFEAAKNEANNMYDNENDNLISQGLESQTIIENTYRDFEKDLFYQITIETESIKKIIRIEKQIIKEGN